MEASNGALVIIIVAIWQIIANIIQIFDYLQDFPLISIYSFTFINLYLVVIYGMWGMKPWIPTVVPLVYGMNILVSLALVFIGPPMLFDIIVTDMGDLAATLTQEEIMTMIAQEFSYRFIFNFIVGLLVIAYVRSEQHEFGY